MWYKLLGLDVPSQKILGELALSSCGLGFEYVLCFGLFLLVVMEDPLKGSTAGVTKVLVLDK